MQRAGSLTAVKDTTGAEQKTHMVLGDAASASIFLMLTSCIMHVQHEIRSKKAKCNSTGSNVVNWLLEDKTLKVNRIRYLKGYK